MRLNVVQFDIISGCQLLCVGCPSAGLQRHVTAIDPAFFRTCVFNIDVDSIGVFRCFNYGEPLLHRRLPEIFTVLAEYRAGAVPIETLEMSTNAQLVNWDQLLTVLRMRVLNRLVVSCDGDGTAESFERLRPPARWRKLIEFLGRIGDLNARENLALELMTRTVVETWADCERWTDVLKPLGWRPEFRSWKYLPQSPKNMTRRAVQPSSGVCKFLEPASQLYVDADGSVVPCCAHPRAAVLGNLGTASFTSIVNGDRRAKFVSSLAERRRDVPICSDCEYGPADNPGPSAGDRMPVPPATG